jgi:hypothetical protein
MVEQKSTPNYDIIGVEARREVISNIDYLLSTLPDLKDQNTSEDSGWLFTEILGHNHDVVQKTVGLTMQNIPGIELQRLKLGGNYMKVKWHRCQLESIKKYLSSKT